MQYEYLRRYLNQILLCPHCKKGFKAVETAPPSNLSTSSRWVHQLQHQKSSQISWPRVSGDRNNHTNSQWGPFFGGTASGTAASSLPAANQAASIGQTGDDNGKRDRGAVSDVGEDPLRKRRLVDDELLRTVSGSNCRSSINGELSQLKTRNMLMRKTVIEISKKLHQWRSAREEKQKAKQNERQQPKHGKNIDTPGVNEQGSPAVGSSSGASAFVTERTAVKMVSMNVPDSDFHDFDTDRTEFSFADNDVWAAYDTDEGMPRFYALIHKVISVNPFKIRFSWLNSKSNSELGPVDWIGSGFTKTCGEFRVGRHETYELLNSFSHKVKWTKGPRGVIRVYPAKGEIWALYRNWSPDWNEETPEEERHAYEMAEVVDDYAEDQGVTVASLVKVPGFKTVYRRRFNDKERRTVPKGEMFRFSHRVPSHPLTGEQAPSGCLELDPAATPVALLQESS
ncbi:hypothetical protein Nepgr_020201 [Nepenthes gracilis]|uniref:DUF3444 domain-containing protein n=1 Tax=Nepenthes gracilis TaxID=150966 RepID=A0AAD3XVY5_NEPGR|nr:hypothetical protein Nepgr_020201 [Nepenthes gracilis]